MSHAPKTDTERLNWLIEKHYSLTAVPLTASWAVVDGYISATGQTHPSAREAIDAAMKATP